MIASTVRFDKVSLVRRDGGWGYRNYWPRQTVFSFMSDSKYFPYVAAPGWPAIHDGLRVTALLESPDDWKSLLGWVNRETGEIAGPTPSEILKQAAVTAVSLCLGIGIVVAGVKSASILAVPGFLFSGYCMFQIFSSFEDWTKAKLTLKALEHLAQDGRADIALPK
jgi:hypothetical protein